MPAILYTYIITNNISNSQYVGSHVCYKKDINNDNYWGSSKYLKEDYELYGKENFSKVIIEECYASPQEMLIAESLYILEYNTLAPNGYNRFLPSKKIGFHMAGAIDSEETKNKKSKAHKGNKHSIETKKNMSISQTGLKKSKETKQKMSISRKQWYENNEHPLKGINRPEFSKKIKGKNNPMFGTHWITNGNGNTRISNNEKIPEGWKLGRQLKS